MPDRVTVTVGPPLARLLAPLVHHLGGPTLAANAIAQRYAHLLDLDRPTLTTDEWCAACDDNNGIWNQAFAHEVPRLGLVEASTAAKWQVDAAAVNGVLAGLSPAGRLAVVEVIERFWADRSRRRERAVLEGILAGG